MKSSSQPIEPAAVSGQNAFSAWFTPWRFAGMFALLLVVCFPSVLAGAEAFVYGDMGQFAYPVAFYHRESFWRGEIPLWNPLNSCGIPFLAQWNTLVCYPPSLFYLLLPLPWSFDLFCIGHIFFAALGMYFLAYRWTNNRFAAAVAGTIFGFNGLTWEAVMWPHFLAALAWMPWFLLATEKMWAGSRRAIVPAALAGAMQMLSGGAEVIIQTWLVLGALFVLRLVRKEPSRRKIILRMLGLGLLVAGLASIQLLPFLDLIAHSQRTSGYGATGLSEVGNMSPAGLINFLVPLFHSARNPQGIWIQDGQDWIISYYLGIGALALAGFALWRARQRRVWFLGGLAVFSLLMAFGEPGVVYGVMKKIIPVFGFIRFPVKFVALTTFAIPLLAAFGINRLGNASSEAGSGEWKRFRIVSLLLAGAAAAVLLAAKLHASGNITSLGANVAVRILMLALICGGLVFLRQKSELKIQGAVQCAVILFLWLDVFTHGSNLSPAAPNSVLEPDAVRSYFSWGHQLEPGVSRALQSPDAFWKMLSTGSSDPALDTIFRRRALPLNLNLLDHVPKIDGFYSSDLKEHLEIFKRVFFTTNEAPGLKDFLGIAYVSNPTNIFDWAPRSSFLPLVTAGQTPSFATDAETLAALFSNSFEPLRTVYLPPEAEGKIHATGQSGAKIISTHFSAQHLEIETEAGNASMVVIAQTFYHPWHAYVDGERTPLWRANEAFQALEVPAGRHQVKIVYEDVLFDAGAVLSALCALGCAGLWFWRVGKSSGERVGED